VVYLVVVDAVAVAVAVVSFLAPIVVAVVANRSTGCWKSRTLGPFLCVVAELSLSSSSPQMWQTGAKESEKTRRDAGLTSRKAEEVLLCFGLLSRTWEAMDRSQQGQVRYVEG